jgi:hypothetical protein
MRASAEALDINRLLKPPTLEVERFGFLSGISFRRETRARVPSALLKADDVTQKLPARQPWNESEPPSQQIMA